MLINGIEKLSQIKPKSKLSTFGLCVSEDSCYFFSDGFYFWKADMEILNRDDMEKFYGTLYFDNDSMKKITEAFTEGSVEIAFVERQVAFIQEKRKVLFSYKEKVSEMHLPKTGEDQPSYVGKISHEMLEQAKMKAPYGDKNYKSLDTIMYLTPKSTVKTTKVYVSVNRVLSDWNLTKSLIQINSDTLMTFPVDSEIYQVGDMVAIKGNGIEVYMPELKEAVNNYMKPLDVFKLDSLDCMMSFNSTSLVSLTNFTNKIYGNNIDGVCLTFSAVSGGFNVVTSDINSVVEDFFPAEHDFIDGFTFYISGKLLANIKHIKQERLNGKLCARGSSAISIGFFSGDCLDSSDSVLLITLLLNGRD